MKRFFRKLHRWIGLLMAAQLLAWMLSGFYFSLFPIEEIRGEHLLRKAPGLQPEDLRFAVGPDEVLAALDEHFQTAWTLESLELDRWRDQVAWRARGKHAGQPYRRLIGASGVFGRLDAEQARIRASEWLLAESDPVSVEWLETEVADGEFRGGPLPVWKLSFEEPESVNLYVHPWTGELLASRTSRWRLFDFFWMLHIMDFEARDDFSHPLLQIAALLGFLVALSGLVFWLMTTRVLRRGRQRVGP